ncbi:MAG: flagellar M-ring protein FliF [Methylobacterium sp.]|nr:flagellar M-ring protein FliF [Methylobacterium sp.]MCA3657789.1 flagellar M-ring protein FliF [Methylobacterium sp.]MCA3662592.1 flagellar M-ring protein FliF [Methylobacterium sp.]MCA3665887.1 flagellar M-ring protein FliF [Methylobacterium sp.]MCA3671299.1 flagellar M-ring protein FliF [Methylobacterium sp.]
MNAILDIVNKLGPQRLVAMGAVTLALVGFFAFLLIRMSQPPMGVLFSELSMQDANTITRELDSKGVRYELRGDGQTVMVPRDSISRLRMEFASKGVPMGGTVGYEIFDKGDSFSSTTFVQGINQLRALEGELARTIRTIDRVQNARVHLAIPEKKLFQRDAQEPRASIVLKLRGELDAGQIRAIRHLAATAVHGLKPEKVSIVDESGRLLADGAGADADTAAIAADKQSSYERRLKGQVEEIVASVVGRGRARVQVAAEMDFNRIQQVTDNFDPESRVVRSTQTRTENQQSTEQRDGQVTVANELPQAQQQQQQQGNPQQREQTARSEEIINYEISKTTRTEIIEGGRVKRLSVAVLVDGVYTPGQGGAEASYQPRSSEELERIAALVRSAIGFDRNRGDQIEVINLRFAEGFPMVDGKQPTLLEQLIALSKEDVLRLVELAIFGILTLLITLLVIRPLLRQMGIGVNPGLVGAGGAMIANGASAEGGQTLALPAPGQEAAANSISGALAAANSNQQQSNISQLTQNLRPGVIDQLGQIVQENPGETVAIVRQWISQPR